MKVNLDQRGIRSLARDPQLYRPLHTHARRALNIARGSAPRGTSGDYARRMFSREARENAWASAYFGSADYKAWWVEFGSRNNRAHHTLVNAARTAGMRVSQIAEPGKGRIGP